MGYAKGFVDIPLEHINIILHCHKPTLYHVGDVWVKKACKDGFDVPQGSYDGSEVSELMRLFTLNKIFHIDNYRDNGLMVVPDNKNANDKIRKILLKFHDLKFSIAAEMNKKIIQYFDVEFDLAVSTVFPYLKPKTRVRYMCKVHPSTKHS